MALYKAVEDITEDDLQALKQEGEAESKTLDYKKALNVENDKTKDEFRRDIASFANASGGYLVYGMKEKDDQPGVPEELCGFDIDKPDSLKRQLNQILEAHIRPRIPNITMQEVPLKNGKFAFVIRIPQSFNKPHQVEIQEEKRKGELQFCIRRDTHNSRMDVDELRVAFTLAETLREKIRGFRMKRIGEIISGETPAKLAEGMKMALHLIPINAFDYNLNIQLPTRPFRDISIYAPIWREGIEPRPNFEGLYVDNYGSYLQIYRNGVIEAVYSGALSKDKHIYWKEFIAELISAIERYLAIQNKIGVQPPILIMLSLLEMKGYSLGNRPNISYSQSYFDRNELILPEVVAEHYEIDISELMPPLNRQIWNSVGIYHE